MKIIIKKSIISLLGLVVMAFGAAFTIKANLGTSPITSVPYVLGQITGLSVGTITIAMHVVFVLFEILLLRKNYEKFQLTQLIVALVFGFFTDFSLKCLQNLIPANYYMRWVFCLLGIVLMGIAVFLEVTASFILIAGEGIVVAIHKVIKGNFAYVKMGFDILLITISVVIGLIFLKSVVGIGLGTVAAALLVGPISKFFMKRCDGLKKWVNN